MPPSRHADAGASARTEAREALPTGAAARPVERWRDSRVARVTDCIAEEVPLAIFYNGLPFAVMMATPDALEDYALGFSLSEGIIGGVDELRGVRVLARLEGIELHLDIPPERAAELGARERSLEGRSGCGVCGTRRIEDVVRTPGTVAAGIRISSSTLQAALHGMLGAQPLNAATGATHAAAWADAGGRIVALREDVGRHNALDKLIGAIALARFDPDAGFLVITSRASYEMVMKAASVGIALVAAVSAPTALAVDLAVSCGMTLIGFARDGDCAVYAHPHRYRGADASEP